jgi:sugar lactone lactonase YvrE
MSGRRLGAKVGLLASLFTIGFALMGFEMLGSRYLNPYFGSGITTWACLISVVLISMMIGYYAGGWAVDRRPGVGLLAGCILLAGLAMGTVPLFADPMMLYFLETRGDGFVAVLTASLAISFLPVALISACSPCVVKLLLQNIETGGKTTGLVYAVSTAGNVAGTLVTTFWLIPEHGTREITYAFAAVLVALALLLFAVRSRLVWRPALLLPLALLPALADGAEARESEARGTVRIEADYPEGPIWIGGALYFAEMTRDRVRVWDGRETRTLWRQSGCGPTSIAPYRGGDLLVLCHLGRKLVALDAAGRTLSEIDGPGDGGRFLSPNDSHADGRGGVYFSDPGAFARGAPANGALYRVAPDGRVERMLQGLRYPNGVAVAGGRLLLSEHLARRVLRFAVAEDGTLVPDGVFLDVAAHLSARAFDYAETGPDGVEIAPDGTVYVAVYGAGAVLAVAPDGDVRRHDVATRFVTNVATDGARVAVVGAYDNASPPMAGLVEIRPRDQFDGAR